MSSREYIISTDSISNLNNPADAWLSLTPPIELDKRKSWEVALVGGAYTNTISNVSAAIGNNTFRYSHNSGANWTVVTLSPGGYSVADVDRFLKESLHANNHYTESPPGSGIYVYPINLGIDLALYRVTVSLSAGFYIDFSNNGTSTLYQLLGFAGAPITTSGTTIAPNGARIYNDIQQLYVKTDIIDNGIRINNNATSGIIRSVANLNFGLPVEFKDPSGDYTYYPVKSHYIESIRMQMLDMKMRVVEFAGDNVTYILKFRPIKE